MKLLTECADSFNVTKFPTFIRYYSNCKTFLWTPFSHPLPPSYRPLCWHSLLAGGNTQNPLSHHPSSSFRMANTSFDRIIPSKILPAAIASLHHCAHSCKTRSLVMPGQWKENGYKSTHTQREKKMPKEIASIPWRPSNVKPSTSLLQWFYGQSEKLIAIFSTSRLTSGPFFSINSMCVFLLLLLLVPSSRTRF